MSYVNLSSSSIGDDDLECLEGLSDIDVLDLSCTAVTDAGLAHLKHLRRLQMLVLLGTHVTEAGLGELRQALPGLAILASPEPSSQRHELHGPAFTYAGRSGQEIGSGLELVSQTQPSP